MEKDKIKLNWKSNIFSTLTNVTESNKIIGVLKSDWFSDTSKLEINDNNYQFVKKGFFGNDFLIKNITENKKIGEIKYDSFKTQATIKLNEKKYIWKQKGFWERSWVLSDKNGVISTYSNKFSGGQIESINNDYLLLIVGLFTTNYYLKMVILILFIILMPVIIGN